MSKKQTSCSVLCIALALAAIPFSVQAADKYWSYTDCGTNWWDYNCWSATFGGVLDGNGQPLDGDDVYLYNAGTSNIQVSFWNSAYPSATLNSLTINATGIGTMTLFQSADNLQTWDETVGDTGTGEVVQSGGTHSVVTNLILGNTATGNGSFSVNYTGSLSAGDITVGNYGTGILNISTGGSLVTTNELTSYIGRYDNSTGSATVTGTGSSWTNNASFAIGGDGAGTLNIENGGWVTSGKSRLGGSSSGQGTVTVSGTGSSWTTSGEVSWVDVSPVLIIGLSGTGTLNIDSGGLVTSPDGDLGYGDTGSGVVTVTGIGSTWTNTGTLNIGLNGTGILSILNGGSVSSQSGSIGGGSKAFFCGVICMEWRFFYGDGAVVVDGVNSTWDSQGIFIYNGTLSILSGGSVTSAYSSVGDSTFAGSVTVDGIDSSWINTGTITIAIDSSFDITNGGSVTSDIFNGDSMNISSGGLATSRGSVMTHVTVDGIGSSWTGTGDSYINATELYVMGGASVTASSFISTETLTVDGIGSTVSSDTLGHGNLTVINGGSVTSTTAATVSSIWIDGSVLIDGIGSTWVSGTIDTDSFTISNGGSVTSLDTTVTGNVNMSGTSLANEDANWDITGSLSVGGLLNLGEYANLTVADTITLNGIHIDGGNLVTGQLNGSLTNSLFDAGTLTVVNAGPTVDIGGATFGNAGGGSFAMVLPQDTLVNDGATLTMYNNSSLATGTLFNEGIVSGDGSVNGLINGGVNSVFAASGGSLVLGDISSFNGFRTFGLIDVGTGAVTLSSQQFAQLGYQTTLNGGTLNAQNGVFLRGGNAIVGSGNVNASIAAQTGSTIFASGNLALGDIGKFDGFYSQGNLQTNEHTVTINDRNEAVLGSLTTLGNTGGAGTLQSSNGLLLQQGNNLIGYGTVNGDFINQGHVEETSAQPADFIEFTGNVSGAGDYAGSIVFSGTFTPGNSPALVSFEDIAFGLDSVLTMEIGGLFAGSQYDVLEGLTGSSATLAGTLDIDLYDLGGGLFAPSLGDSFDILTAEVLTGKFDLLTLAVLGGGLDWQLDYLFDEIGTIDIVRLSVVSASTVPVPPAVWLFASGLLGLVAVARRKKLA